MLRHTKGRSRASEVSREMLDPQWRLEHEHRVREAIERREEARDMALNTRADQRDIDAKARHGHELSVFGLILGALTILVLAQVFIALLAAPAIIRWPGLD